jgi:phi13 family phage major tail protein
MARIGVRWPVYNTYTVTQNVDGTETESAGVGKVFGKAMSEDISITADAVTQYADDGEAEVSAPFTGGTIKSELNDITDTAEAEACGHTITEDGELIANADDEAPYMRRGFVFPALVNNVKKYIGRVYPRVKYAPMSEKFDTKGKSLTFTGVTMPGTIMRNKDGDWKWQKSFDTADRLLLMFTQNAISHPHMMPLQLLPFRPIMQQA